MKCIKRIAVIIISTATLYSVAVIVLIQKYPPYYALGYGFDSTNISLGPPKDMVISYVICCKDVGAEYKDEFHLISSILTTANNNDARDRRDLVQLGKDAVRRLIKNKKLNINWINPKTGQAPLHDAIVTSVPWQVMFLLDTGADPCVRVSSINRRYSGLDSEELVARILENTSVMKKSNISEREENLKQIRSILESSGISCH